MTTNDFPHQGNGGLRRRTQPPIMDKRGEEWEDAHERRVEGGGTCAGGATYGKPHAFGGGSRGAGQRRGPGISFVDCIFDKCEWSNVRLTNAAFQRARLQGCRMTGLEIMRGALINVAFDGCMLDYASFAECKLDHAVFSDCRLRDSLWSENRLSRVRFDHSDLERAQWARTQLSGLDMTTCRIAGWTVSLTDLRGLKVTAAQVLDLAGLLGVEIVS